MYVHPFLETLRKHRENNKDQNHSLRASLLGQTTREKKDKEAMFGKRSENTFIKHETHFSESSYQTKHFTQHF